MKNHIRTDHPNLKLLEDLEGIEPKMEEQHESSTLSEEMSHASQSLSHLDLQQSQHVLEQSQGQQQHDPHHDQMTQQVLQSSGTLEVQSEVQAGLNAQPQTTYILPPGVAILTDNNQVIFCTNFFEHILCYFHIILL